MFVKEAKSYLFEEPCSKEDTTKARERNIKKFILLEDGRMVPVDPGGMVEVALIELGAKVVEVEDLSGEKVNQEI